MTQTTTPAARTPFARTRPAIDLGHFGSFEVGKLTYHRQSTLERIGEEMDTLREEAAIRDLGDDATPEQLEAEHERVKAAEKVAETRYVEAICEQIETMLLRRDPTTRELGPAEGLAQQLLQAFRDPDVPEDKAVGLDDLVAALEEVMSVVDDEKAAGNG